MTSWIVLIALIALFTAVVRHHRATEPPPVPPGYDGDRMLAEWRALGRPRLF
jgi:hypothetical protein